jgi:hypothetical protein
LPVQKNTDSWHARKGYLQHAFSSRRSDGSIVYINSPSPPVMCIFI